VTAANGTFLIGGGLGAGLAATTLTFYDTTTAAAANITASGGGDGSGGGAIIFAEESKGGTASVTLSGNAELDISTHNARGVTIGSLAGQGSVSAWSEYPHHRNQQPEHDLFGVIQDGGGVSKSGTGSGSGAFLALAAGTNVQAMLTIQGTLIFNADATYAYTFRGEPEQDQDDKVIASGVIINSSAMIALSGQTRGRLTTGLTLTLISNTSANSTSGSFANLADGGIVTVNGNHLQASYEGGDGNDLTLTVVP
jgi:hypothetical protein